MSQGQQQPSTAATGSPPEKTNRGIVKLVLSGDSLVIRGQPRNGPPPEKTIALSNIMAPKLARRGKDGQISKEDPYAWESREYLRKLVIGKEVQFFIEHVPSSSNRAYGSVWLSVNGEPKNLTDMMVSEGLVEVRQTGKQNEEIERITLLEAAAKSAKKGLWNKEGDRVKREIVWTMTNDELRTFVERNQKKEFSAVIEHVRDGASVRVILLPSFTLITLAMSGIKCPMFKREGEKEVPEAFAEQARFFTESRLLQRDIKVILEGVSNQLVYGSIKHPAGNIAELLLKEGYARCVDWSMAFVSKEKDKLRAAERHAKKEQLRIWKGFTPAVAPEISPKAKNFTGKVMEIGNGDNLVVKTGDGACQKIFFSSFRPPRLQKEEDAPPSTTSKPRPLYDIPYMFEAREFMRKKLIGKKVNVIVDYIKPAQDSFPQKTCCTVIRDDVNIAEALVSKGFGYCLRHRQDDDQRSSRYDDLLAAEARAIKNLKGVHSKKEYALHRVADISQDSNRAKQFLPFLQKAGRTMALVEFVASGSRARLYLQKDTCLINFILAGVNCPRAPNTRDGTAGEPYGQDALTYTKELIMHREVEVEVEHSDKGGNFIGWLYYEGKNLSVSLVTEGLSKVLPQAERSSHANDLFSAEEKAKNAKKRIWKDYVEPVPVEEDPEESESQTTPTESSEDSSSAPPERKTNFQKVVITEVTSCITFWTQQVEQGPKLDQLMGQLRSDLVANPPLPGSFKPSKGMQCIAKFTDGLWYRAKIEKLEGNKVHVLYLDFGNREVIPSSDTAKTPAGYSDSPFAKEYTLACCMPPNQDFLQDSIQFLAQEVLDKVVYMNVEYKTLGQEFVTLQLSPDDTEDVGCRMISEGLLRTERRKEKRLSKLVADYQKAEEGARKERSGMWCYGDSTPDDAREFGYQRK